MVHEVKVLSTAAVSEKIDGKKAKATRWPFG
jgi:hypothetical protein